MCIIEKKSIAGLSHWVYVPYLEDAIEIYEQYKLIGFHRFTATLISLT